MSNPSMSAEFHGGDLGGSPGSQIPNQHRGTTPNRSLAVVVILTLFAIGLMVFPRQPLYYPNVVIEAAEGLQIDFLLNGRQDRSSCVSAAASIANAITSSCIECKTRSQTCIKNPSAELRQRFGEAPLPVPSGRLPNGIVIFSPPDSGNASDLALAACRESERQAALDGGKAKVRCYGSGVVRPYTDFEKYRDQSSHTTFTLMLAFVGTLILGLVAAIVFTLIRHRRFLAHTASVPVDNPIFPTHPILEKFTLAGVDVLVLIGTFLLLSWPASEDINRWSRLDRDTVVGNGVIIMLTVSWFWLLLEHYARRRPFWDELREIFRVLIIMFMVASAAAFVSGLETGRSSHIIAWLLNCLLIPLGRAGAKQLLDDFGLWQRPAIIIGSGENARDAWLAIKNERGMGYRVLGFMAVSSSEADDPKFITIGNESLPVFAVPSSVEVLLENLGRPQVILALDSLMDQECQPLVQRLLVSHSNIHIVPSIRGLPLFGTQLSHFFSHQVLFLTVRNNLSRPGYQWIKRAFDIAGASALLIILSPLMAYVAWRIWREDGRPVIFKQPRLAKGSGEFGFLKFRSMVKDADRIIEKWRATNSPEWQEYYANNFKLKNDPRVLGVGSWIRAWSVDELPQIINVLKGEMSLVGPRPLLGRELSEYGDSINYYRLARPGITGLWQISGRSHTKFTDRAVLDEWYVQNWSLWYDIAILVKTIKVVLQGRGAY